MSQSQFYANESVSLEKTVNTNILPVETNVEDLDFVYEIHKCADWIKTSNFKKVCLQFPDYLLPDSTEVAFKLQSILNQTVYILGDTTYESCCIDYIAAAHINADAIVHFGPVCFSKTSANIPYLNVYEKHNINIEELCASFKDQIGAENGVTVLIDSDYIHLEDKLRLIFEPHKNVDVQRIDNDPLVIGSKVILFIGRNERKLANISFKFESDNIYYFDNALKKFDANVRVLKRRNYLIEKIKDSKTFGIVIGTLCVQNYLKVIDRLKALIKSRGKKYYILSVGRPTVAKLANFEEVEIYIVITCSLSEIYENRDFYRPIVTPFDVEVALNTDRNEDIKFSYDYNSFLDRISELNLKECKNEEEADVSLLTNNIRTFHVEEDTGSDGQQNSTQITVKSNGTVMLKGSHGAEFLSQRSWKGLEHSVEIKEATLAQEGRLGTARKYKNEPT